MLVEGIKERGNAQGFLMPKFLCVPLSVMPRSVVVHSNAEGQLDSVGGERGGTCGEGLQNQELGAGEGQGKNLGSFLNIPPHVP